MFAFYFIFCGIVNIAICFLCIIFRLFSFCFLYNYFIISIFVIFQYKHHIF